MMINIVTSVYHMISFVKMMMLKKCTFTSSNTLLKNVVAVPLEEEEIEDMNFCSLHELEFDEDDSMHILKSFVKLMLPENSDE